MIRIGLSIVALFGCHAALGFRIPKRPSSMAHTSTAPSLNPQPVVYQISTRPWLYALAQAGVPANCGNGRGTQYVCLRDVPDEEWAKIKNDHTDMVWLMGMWQLGEEGLQDSLGYIERYRPDLPDITAEDIIGSPYAVVDYVVNPEIGNAADLAGVRAKLHSLGMGLMLDFVPNHLARDAKLFYEHPEAFIQRPSGDTSPDEWWYNKNGKTVAYGGGPYDGPWTDTLQLNYFSTEAVQLIEGILMTIASQADGIRVDMAHLVLNEVFSRKWGEVLSKGGFGRPPQEFWSGVLSRVKSQYPGIVFVSEAYDYYMTTPPEQEYLTNLGIDYSYNKVVLDKLEHKHLEDFRGYVSSQSNGYLAQACHFTENHDEPRAALSLGGQEQSFAGAIAALTLPGMRLTHFGQYDGLSNRLGVHLRRWTPEAPNSALHARYTKLMEVLAHQVFHYGSWTFIDVPADGSGWRLTAWRWEHDGEKRLVVINFSEQQAWGNVQVADAFGGDGSDNVELTDLLTGTSFSRSANELRTSGLVVGLPAWQAHIFAY